MKNRKLTEISNEELVKEEKKAKSLTLVFAGILIVLFAVTIFSIIRNGFSALVATPVALLILLVVFLNNWNELKKEIKSRSL